MTADRIAEQQPRTRPIEVFCRACQAWLGTVPPGTPWFRGRCFNRSVGGLPGRKCGKYGETQRYPNLQMDNGAR